MRATLEERLRARLVETDEGCLLWTGTRRENGYGVIVENRVRFSVHRVAWELAHGRIRKGKVVRHRCGERACANVEHLFLASKRDVARDVLPSLKRNLAKTHCRAGHRLAGKNLYRWRGQRQCRACHRERELRRYHAKKAAA